MQETLLSPTKIHIKRMHSITRGQTGHMIFLIITLQDSKYKVSPEVIEYKGHRVHVLIVVLVVVVIVAMGGTRLSL